MQKQRRSRDGFVYEATTLNPRPPAAWFSRMFAKVSTGYPRKAGETLEHWRKDIGRITAGIWWKYPAETRAGLIRQYDKKTVPALRNPVMLPCPLCGMVNPVPRAGVYLRCSKCGKPLVSVKVRK